ncbi:MAG TPA: hypothetical protein VJH03_07060 [Blastocatellia bacterium]|nr:hypothetical protein [Blastocatellia bacterium]
MNRLVRQLAKLAFLTVIVAMTSVVASAQTTGTVTINGSVGNAASLRWWTFTNNNATSGTNAPNTQNSPLVFTLDLGDVSPNNTNAYVGGTVQVIMRTNAPSYTLNSYVSASSGFGAVGNAAGDISLADIGFGVQDLAVSGTGALVSAGALAGSTITAAYDADPGAAVKDADGIPSFSRTLNDLGTTANGPTLVSGPRISKGGNNNSPNNGLTVNTKYAVGPQFFTPGSFSATATFTLVTP